MPLLSALEFLTLAALWGASFLLMRVAVPELGPFSLMLLRCAIGAATLLPVLLLRNGLAPLRAHARDIALVGAVNSAIPFVLLAVASLVLTAGVTSILNSLAPLWTAVIAWFWFGDRLDRWQRIGLALGIAGVVVLVAARGGTGADAELPLAGLLTAFGAGVLATVAYGFGANLTRRCLQGVPPLAIATGSQISATLVLLLPGLYFWPSAGLPGAHTLLTVLALGTFCTGFAYLLFFRLIGNLGATRAITVTFVIPVFGLAWGAWFLDESITPGTVLGAAIIVLGTALAIRVLRRRRLAG